KLLSPKRIEETVHEGIVFGVKKVEILYEGTAKFGDYINVETKIITLGSSSITFHHDLFREYDNTLLAKVDCVRLVMELNTNKLLSINAFFNKYLA
ncbi:MAG: acyl-CoA thioesterase, partial [Promethearchaeota archaeon]